MERGRLARSGATRAPLSLRLPGGEKEQTHGMNENGTPSDASQPRPIASTAAIMRPSRPRRASAWETMSRLVDKNGVHQGLALANIVANLGLGLFVVWVGMQLARAFP